MDEIINLLINRDGISYDDAKEAYFDCKAAVMDAIDSGDFTEVDEILMSELGIEPDYIFNFID